MCAAAGHARKPFNGPVAPLRRFVTKGGNNGTPLRDEGIRLVKNGGEELSYVALVCEINTRLL
jgi:hypothetical protein